MAKWTVDDLDGISFAHLIGKHGASSTAIATWKNENEPGCFIPAAERSNAKTDPRKDGYIFGQDGKFENFYIRIHEYFISSKFDR